MEFRDFIIHELVQFLSCEGMNNLLATTHIFEDHKKMFNYLELNKIHSLLYSTDNLFEKLVNSRISRQKQQLSLKLLMKY